LFKAYNTILAATIKCAIGFTTGVGYLGPNNENNDMFAYSFWKRLFMKWINNCKEYRLSLK
jgi:hypothetical protein